MVLKASSCRRVQPTLSVHGVFDLPPSSLQLHLRKARESSFSVPVLTQLLSSRVNHIIRMIDGALNL